MVISYCGFPRCMSRSSALPIGFASPYLLQGERGDIFYLIRSGSVSDHL